MNFLSDRKKLLVPIVIAIVVIVVLLRLAELREIIELFKQQNLLFLILAIASQVAIYFNLSLLFKVTAKFINYFIKFKRAIKVAISYHFLNQLVPSFNLTGNTFLFYTFKKDNVSEGKTLIMVIIQILCGYISFFTVIFFGFLILFLFHKFILAYFFAFIAFTALILFMIYYINLLVRDKEKFKQKSSWLVKKLFRLFKKEFKQKRFDHEINEFYKVKSSIFENKKIFSQPVLVSLMRNVLELLTIYFIFLSFGINVHVGVLIVGYGLALLLGWVSLIPAGLGVFEFSMSAIYATLGVPFTIAVATTLLYRVFSLWLPIIPGIFMFRSVIRD